jgi:hypothetical protein
MSSTDVTYITAFSFTKDWLLIAASPDDDEPYTPFTLWYVYSHNDFDEPWTHTVTRWWAVSCCNLSDKVASDWATIGMSQEGELEFVYSDLKSIYEKIPGAGVNSPDARNWGYLTSVKQIGEHLYACGYSGQVYKRYGANSWLHMDEGLLQAPVTTKDTVERIGFTAIDGAHENAIYAIGYKAIDYYPPIVKYFNGQQWFDIKLPEVAERLTAIFVESEQSIWLCGNNGTLLVGNANQGFKSLSSVEDNQLFTSVCKFESIVYLASNMGLFAYDTQSPKKGIHKISTGLKPELQNANIVCAEGGILWSIGSKDIGRFDGKNWTRIHHRDNKKIGS